MQFLVFREMMLAHTYMLETNHYTQSHFVKIVLTSVEPPWTITKNARAASNWIENSLENSFIFAGILIAQNFRSTRRMHIQETMNQRIANGTIKTWNDFYTTIRQE